MKAAGVEFQLERRPIRLERRPIQLGRRPMAAPGAQKPIYPEF